MHVTPPPNTMIAVLVEAREEAGIDRATFAKRYGAAATVITRLEGGKHDLRESTIIRYAKALGLRPVLVLEPIPRRKRAAPAKRARRRTAR